MRLGCWRCWARPLAPEDQRPWAAVGLTLQFDSHKTRNVRNLLRDAMNPDKPRAYRWIKTECGRAKYEQLAARTGLLARLRLAWFVLIAALRDWQLP